MGAITDIVRAIVPASYRAMIGSTGTDYYTQPMLQEAADYVKFRLFSTNNPTYAFVVEAGEATIYDVQLRRYMGKLTALQFIPAAIDFWGDQLVSESTQMPEENVEYQRADLWKLYDRLLAEVQGDFDNLAPIYGVKIYNVQGMLPRVSYGDNGRRVLITPDPQDFPALDGGTSWGYTLPWALEVA